MGSNLTASTARADARVRACCHACKAARLAFLGQAEAHPTILIDRDIATTRITKCLDQDFGHVVVDELEQRVGDVHLDGAFDHLAVSIIVRPVSAAVTTISTITHVDAAFSCATIVASPITAEQTATQAAIPDRSHAGSATIAASGDQAVGIATVTATTVAAAVGITGHRQKHENHDQKPKARVEFPTHVC